MFVLRKTMERELAAERERGLAACMNTAAQYGKALEQVNALQRQLSAWVMNEPSNVTPEQFADMFYAHDDKWQAAFFNVMQNRVQAHHDSLPPPRPGSFNPSPGVPAGEAQWWHMGGKLNDSGFETLEAMYEHAKSHREREQAA